VTVIARPELERLGPTQLYGFPGGGGGAESAPMKDDPQNHSQTTALIRFQAVSFILDQMRNARTLAQALREASARPWPDETGDFYAVRTLEDWHYAYQKHGFDGLKPQPRADRGARRVLDPKTAAWILDQVTQNSKTHLTVLYSHWKSQDPTLALPSLSTVYDLLHQHGLDRKSLRAGRLETGPTKAFEAPFVNDLWMVDFSPGPVLVHQGKPLGTHLCVLIDDCSRLLPFAAYYGAADTEAFHHALKEAVLRRGLPRKLYTDQGKPFVNHHTALVCAQLGVRLLHCKPYHSWSKGKVERVIQTIQQGFESTLRLEGQAASTLEEINRKFSAWVQIVYHQRPHSSTGASPEARYQLAAKNLRRLEPGLDIDPLFYVHLERTVRKDGTVRLDGALYEVPLSLRALKIQLRLDPWKRARIEVWHQGKFIGLARKAPLQLNAENGGSHAYDR
jgi:transposase InsO family protein